MPAGSKRRKKYDEFVQKRAYSKLKKKYSDIIDSKTAGYWTKLEVKCIQEKEKRPHNNNYDYWMDCNDTTARELESQKNVKFEIMPKISIITNISEFNVNFFRELLYFMAEQTYSNWELCIVDSNKKPLKEIQKIIKKESRIKYKFLGETSGISESLNEALNLVTGEYIGVLDSSDYLSKDCLYEIVKAINENSKVEFIYSDEDKVREVGEQRFDPHFKQDFAIDTLRSQNYIGKFSVIKKEVMNELGGFRSEFDSAYDYDLFLRMSEIVSAENIKHIIKVLYHRRAIAENASFQDNVKSENFETEKLVIEDHLKRVRFRGKSN